MTSTSPPPPPPSPSQPAHPSTPNPPNLAEIHSTLTPRQRSVLAPLLSLPHIQWPPLSSSTSLIIENTSQNTNSTNPPEPHYVMLGLAYSHICNVLFQKTYSTLSTILKKNQFSRKVPPNTTPSNADTKLKLSPSPSSEKERYFESIGKGPLSNAGYREKMWVKGTSSSGEGARDLLAIWFNYEITKMPSLSLEEKGNNFVGLPKRLTTAVVIKEELDPRIPRYVKRRKRIAADALLLAEGKGAVDYDSDAEEIDEDVINNDDNDDSNANAQLGPSVYTVLTKYFNEKLNFSNLSKHPASKAKALNIAKDYVTSFDRFNRADYNGGTDTDNANINKGIEKAHNEDECVKFLREIYFRVDEETKRPTNNLRVKLYPTCLVNGHKELFNQVADIDADADADSHTHQPVPVPVSVLVPMQTTKGTSYEFDALLVDEDSNEILLCIEMKKTFYNDDISRKREGLRLAYKIQENQNQLRSFDNNNGNNDNNYDSDHNNNSNESNKEDEQQPPTQRSPFRSKSRRNTSLSHIRLPSHSTIPIIYIAERVLASPERDEVKKACCSWLKYNPRDIKHCRIGSIPTEEGSGQLEKLEPVLEMDVSRAYELINSRGVSLGDIIQAKTDNLEVPHDPEFPFVGVVKLPVFFSAEDDERDLMEVDGKGKQRFNTDTTLVDREALKLELEL